MAARNRQGFTLLEVVVALGITSVCLALVSVSMAGLFRANDRAREHLELQQGLNETMERMRLMLQAAYISPHYVNQFNTKFETMDIDNLADPYDALTFTTLAHSTHRINAKEADMVEVTFFTEDEPPIQTPEGEVRLRRLRVRAGGAINDRFEVEGGTVYTLADHVTALRFEYLDGFGEWKTEWIPADNNYTLPCMVRITLALRTPELAEEEAEILAPMEMSKMRCRFDDERVFERR